MAHTSFSMAHGEAFSVEKLNRGHFCMLKQSTVLYGWLTHDLFHTLHPNQTYSHGLGGLFKMQTLQLHSKFSAFLPSAASLCFSTT